MWRRSPGLILESWTSKSYSFKALPLRAAFPFAFRAITFCLIAAINIFFRCPDWPTAKAYTEAIFFSGIDSYVRMVTHWKYFPDDLAQAGWWVLFVFLAHEAERYFKVMDRILQARTAAWAAVCLLAFYVILSFGISGPEFIYYQF